MILYRYDKDTKEYIGNIPACLDPMASKREGKPIYVILQNSTLVEPKFEGGKVPVFNGKDWDLVPDYRGRTVYRKTTGNPLLVTEIGDVPAGYSLVKPVILQDLKLEKIKQASSLCSFELNKVIEVKGINVKVSDKPLLLAKLEENEKAKYIILNIEDRIVGEIIERENLRYVTNYLYLREAFLSIKKNEIIKEINKCKNEKEVNNVVISFDISSRIERYASRSLEEIEKYIKSALEG